MEAFCWRPTSVPGAGYYKLNGLLFHLRAADGRADDQVFRGSLAAHDWKLSDALPGVIGHHGPPSTSALRVSQSRSCHESSTEFGRVPQLLLGDIGSKTTKRPIICQSAPGNGIMAVAQPNKSTKAHDGISHATYDLVDDEVINLSDILSICVINFPFAS